MSKALSPMSQREEGDALMKFVSIHAHTTFSFLDAIGTPAEHVAMTSGYGATALAITDHG